MAAFQSNFLSSILPDLPNEMQILFRGVEVTGVSQGNRAENKPHANDKSKKTEVLTVVYKVLVISSQPWHQLPDLIAHCPRPHLCRLASWLFLKRPSLLSPQGLCTCCSVFLEKFLPLLFVTLTLA